MTQCGVHILIGKDTKQHSHIAKERGDDDALCDNQFQDAPGLGANGLTDAKLMGALLDGYQHDIRDTYDTTQQRKQPDDPQECMDNRHTIFHL